MIQSSHKDHKNNGFTLIEILVVTIIISVIAALSAPNLLGLFRRSQVNSSLAILTGTIKETQRQSIRKGAYCQINIDTVNNLLTANPNNCLLSDRKIDNNIIIRTNLSGTPPNISFSHRGSTTKSGTIVVSSNLESNQKCFVISLGLGITRTGNYNGSSSGSVSATNCDSTS